MIAALVLGATLAAGPAATPAGPASSSAVHQVVTGDTLWAIARGRWGDPYLWPRLYAANRAVIGVNPDLIYPGERLRLILVSGPASGRAIFAAAATPRSHGDGDGQAVVSDGGGAARGGPAPAGGTLSCSGLERLWTAAGGPRWAALTAAEVAMAESGGRQYATGPYGERGYWQVSPDHGALSTYDALGNARAAVIISSQGRDWSPWTTWRTGAYRGLC